MFQFYFKIGPLKLPPNAKVISNRNFKCVYLGTINFCLQTYTVMNEAELCILVLRSIK